MGKRSWWILGGAAAGILAAAVVVISLNVKTVAVAEGVKCRVVFGNISGGEAGRLIAAANKDLLGKKKYGFARDAYLLVVNHHHGEWRDEAYLGLAQTFLGQGKEREGYVWLQRLAREHPKGSVVERGQFDAVVGAELERLLSRPPLRYRDAVGYINLLETVGSADAGKWRGRLKDIIETPFTVTADYAHEKGLSYVVRETAARDARSAALFYARENVPPQLLKAIKTKADFGGVVSDEALMNFIQERVVYVDAVDKVTRDKGLGGAEDQGEINEERKRKGLGELPEEWANAFLAAENEKGWVAAASVTGRLENITLSEILKYGGVDPLTAAPSRK